MLVVNGYFRTQPVSGQQRYATEIADRLLASVPNASEVRPSMRMSGRAAEWIDLQTRLPFHTRGAPIVSLTARTPVLAKRQIVTIHDLFPITNPEWFSRPYALLHRRLLRHHLRHAAAIAVVSEPVRQQVAALAADGIDVFLAPNAPTAALQQGDGRLLAEHHVPDQFYLAVGNLEPRKNLRRLVAAYSMLDPGVRGQVPLLIVGGEAAAFRSVPELADPVPGVRLLGRVSDSLLAALYSRASAFVSVSLDEGFGIPVIEAAGVINGPLVLSDIRSYRWIAETADPVFVDPLSTESIADGLRRALNAPFDERRTRAIVDRFSWDETAAAFASAAHAVVSS